MSPQPKEKETIVNFTQTLYKHQYRLFRGGDDNTLPMQ